MDEDGGELLLLPTVVGGVEAADVTDAADPLVHLFFRVGHQVEDAVDGLDVEYVAVLQVLLAERQPGIHLRGQRRRASHPGGALASVGLSGAIPARTS